MKITSPIVDTSNRNANSEALLSCQAAFQYKDRGDYAGAQRAMHSFWHEVGSRPNTTGLDQVVAAEILLCAGVLTSWIGSKNQVSDAQNIAKDLLSESINCFEAEKDSTKVAVAESELAYCYWREGALSEARAWLHAALNKLTFEGASKARAILKLSTIEWTSGRFREALHLLKQNESLFRLITNPTIKGGYHTELAIIHRNLATTENRVEFFRRAINEYHKAEGQFRLAGNQIYRADVLNNVGFLLFKLSRYKEAHNYLDEARRLAVRCKDRVHVAQIDESRAQVLIAQREFVEAERIARTAVSVFRKAGSFSLMAEALITQGIALARQRETDRAEFIFQQGIEAAYQVGAWNIAGLAALTLLEETPELSPATLHAAYRQAREWLKGSQNPEIKIRLADAAGRIVARVNIELTAEEAVEILLAHPVGLRENLRRYEGEVIKRALAQVSGSITHAASLLDLNYQSLAFIIETRHPHLLKERSPVHRRGRKSR